MKILKGYRLTVTSWKNDADNYKTSSLQGLDKNRTSFLVAIIKEMTPRCWDKSKFGNLLRMNRDLPALEAFDSFILETVEKHGGIGSLYGFDNLWNANNKDTITSIVEDDLRELDLVGGDDFATRVMESYVVEFLDQDMDIPEVTDQFQ